MTLDKLLRNVVLVSSLSLFGYNCASTSPEPASCSKDTDCKGERVCVQGVCQQQGRYGGDVTGSASKDYKYIWGIGNCEKSYNKEELLSKFKAPVEFVRTFSYEEIDRSGDLINEKCFDAYQCILKKNINIYVLKTDKGIRLIDNLFLFTNDTYPGKEECFKMIESKSWYTDCFKKGSNCPEP